jgi:hypothetical protein
MEYRFFYSINEQIFDHKWRRGTNLENRIDIYFILSDQSDEFHFEYGLKLRNKKKLELKKRQQHFDNGQEYWIKTIQSNKKISIDDIDSIINILNKSNENQLINRLTSSSPMILCYAEKFREQRMIGFGRLQESTGLHLKFIRSNDQSQIGNDLFFETVCIEQLNSKLIDEKIIENLLENYPNISINPMSYPEFLFRQYQQIMNSFK